MYTEFSVTLYKNVQDVKPKKQATWRVVHNLEEDFLDTLFHAFAQSANPKYYTVEKFASFVRGKNKGVFKCYAVGRLVRFLGFNKAFKELIVLEARRSHGRPEELTKLTELFIPGQLYSEGKEKDPNGERLIEHMATGQTISKSYCDWKYEYDDDQGSTS